MILAPPEPYVRPPGIGASMVGTIAMANPYGDPVELWEELTGLRPPFAGSLDTRIGSALEPVIAQEWVALHGNGRTLEKGETVRHPEHDWAYATPDYTILEAGEARGLVEIKSCRYVSKPGGPHDLRPAYKLQLRWQLACRGLPRGEVFIHYMAAPKDQRFERIEVERDREIEAGLVELCRLFWRHVETKTPLPEQFHRAA